MTGPKLSWPVSRQILVPMLAVTVTASAVNAFSAAWSAASRRKDELTARLDQIASVVSEASFPRSPGVLARLEQLSGADFVVRPQVGSESVVSTLAEPLSAGAIDELFRGPVAGADQSAATDGATSSSTARDHRTQRLDQRDYLVTVRPPVGIQRETIAVLYPADEVRAEQWSAAWPALIVGLVGTGALVPVCLRVSRWIARRVGQIEAGVQRLASGDYAPLPIREPPADELDELVRGVNQLAARLSELVAQTVTMERTRLLAQVAGGLAHQLRNSIAGARMAIQWQAQRLPTGIDRQGIEVALQQLQLTEQQVRGVLALGPRSQIQRTWHEPSVVAREVIQLLRPVFEHRQLQFTPPETWPPGRLLLDLDAVRASLINLLQNAIDAAGAGSRASLDTGKDLAGDSAGSDAAAGGQVRLDVVADDAGCEFIVRDNGPGVPPDLADQLGQPFVSGKPDGVGLGLALARQCAHDHAGQLTWERVDDWTVFRLQLRNRAADSNSSP